MVRTTSSHRVHVFQNAALISLSLLFLPVTSSLVFASLALASIFRLGQNEDSAPARSSRKTVLVTGVGMTKGLTLARAFHKAGHRVIGADFEADGALSPGRFSNALSKFHPLQRPSVKHGSAPYIQGLLDTIQFEHVDLWVSCSGVASAVEDGEAKEIIESRTPCKAIQFDVATTQTLHEKHTFIEKVRNFGLTTPETYTIKGHEQAQLALKHAPKDRKYIMKPIGMDDASRGDMTLLPKSSWRDTLDHLARMKISEKNAWILQQYVVGEEFCTHALVINGNVKVFVSCPSSELLMHYEALPADSALNVAMLRFTEDFASQYGTGFTGHLSFDFLVENTTPQDPAGIVLYPIECNPRAHTAVVLFEESQEMVLAYLALLEKGLDHAEVVSPMRPHKYFWIGHDMVASLVIPLGQLLLLNTPAPHLLTSLRASLSHMLSWRDGTFSFDDPLPFLALYHLYWPIKFFNCIVRGPKWSRINVSTLKMFEC